MRYCKDCWNFDRCNVERKTVDFAVDDGVCRNFEGKPMTNADRIRAMTDEELANCLYEIGFDCHLCSEHERLSDNPFLRYEKCDEKCTEHCLKWLQQPAEGE